MELNFCFDCISMGPTVDTGAFVRHRRFFIGEWKKIFGHFPGKGTKKKTFFGFFFSLCVSRRIGSSSLIRFIDRADVIAVESSDWLGYRSAISITHHNERDINIERPSARRNRVSDRLLRPALCRSIPSASRRPCCHFCFHTKVESIWLDCRPIHRQFTEFFFFNRVSKFRHLERQPLRRPFPLLLWSRSITWFLPSFTGLYWVVLGCTGLYWVLLGWSMYSWIESSGPRTGQNQFTFAGLAPLSRTWTLPYLTRVLTSHVS